MTLSFFLKVVSSKSMWKGSSGPLVDHSSSKYSSGASLYFVTSPVSSLFDLLFVLRSVLVFSRGGAVVVDMDGETLKALVGIWKMMQHTMKKYNDRLGWDFILSIFVLLCNCVYRMSMIRVR